MCVCVYVYNIDIRKLTIRMSVAIYMFRCLQSVQRKKKKKKRRQQQQKREWKRKRRCGLLLTPHALHLLCMGSRFNTEHCCTNVRIFSYAHINIELTHQLQQKLSIPFGCSATLFWTTTTTTTTTWWCKLYVQIGHKLANKKLERSSYKTHVSLHK